MTTPSPAALLVRPAVGAESARAAVVGAGTRWVGSVAEAASVVSALETRGVRWVWWSAAGVAAVTVQQGCRPARAWDLAEAHRLLTGRWKASPTRVWAAAHGLPVSGRPAKPTFDLFSTDVPDVLRRDDGYLHPDPFAWADTDERLLTLAEAALSCADAQRQRLEATWPRLVATVMAESAAAMLCVELGHDGLPVDVEVLRRIVTDLGTSTQERDAEVLRHVPGREHTVLRNPLAVKELLQSVGIDVPTTRKYVLEGFRDAHPVVSALLKWRHDERLISTYGVHWIGENMQGGRLRGQWSACDGAAGRMTATAGLHNLPAELRRGVVADEGWVLVRADLGQVEPRVLAVVAGDAAFAQATMADDLYLPVAQHLGLQRSEAKIAVLAAMYGQRSGAAGQALKRLERAYPVAMTCLDAAYEVGVRGETLRTWGGRLVRTHSGSGVPDPDHAGSRGRFARNALIQGSAAELFKAWAATVRAALHRVDPTSGPARIVLCLHDELVIHAPAQDAERVVQVVRQCLDDAARRWCGGAPVRFVAEVTVGRSWADAKEGDPGATALPVAPGAAER